MTPQEFRNILEAMLRACDTATKANLDTKALLRRLKKPGRTKGQKSNDIGHAIERSGVAGDFLVLAKGYASRLLENDKARFVDFIQIMDHARQALESADSIMSDPKISGNGPGPELERVQAALGELREALAPFGIEHEEEAK